MGANRDMRGIEAGLEIEFVDDVLPQSVIADHAQAPSIIMENTISGLPQRGPDLGQLRLR
jgi:hypothetical protein